jgi:hypothetical protein
MNAMSDFFEVRDVGLLMLSSHSLDTLHEYAGRTVSLLQEGVVVLVRVLIERLISALILGEDDYVRVRGLLVSLRVL